MIEKKIHNHLELLINDLSISKKEENFLKNKTGYLKNLLRKSSNVPFDSPKNIIEIISNKLHVKSFWYGGSFDRGVYINKKFDLDIYMIYTLINKNQVKIKKLSSGNLMNMILFHDLIYIKENLNKDLSILSNPPFSHAIPIRFDFNNKTLFFDLIFAFELPQNYLLVPNGMEYVKKINLKLEEEALSKINDRQNGKATKLIRLLKFWNWYWNNPVKSYLIQRLVEEIFCNRLIRTWNNAVKIFFNQSLYFLNQYLNGKIVLRDRVYTNKSILDDYEENKIIDFYSIFNNANFYAQNNRWNELFGDF